MADKPIQDAVIRHARQDMANVPTASVDPPKEASHSNSPSTSATLWAAWRQGLKDLQTVVLGSLGGTHEEPGSIANPTALEVYEEKHQESQPFERETRSYLDVINEAGRHNDQDRDMSR